MSCPTLAFAFLPASLICVWSVSFVFLSFHPLVRLSGRSWADCAGSTGGGTDVDGSRQRRRASQSQRTREEGARAREGSQSTSFLGVRRSRQSMT